MSSVLSYRHCSGATPLRDLTGGQWDAWRVTQVGALLTLAGLGQGRGVPEAEPIADNLHAASASLD